MTSASRIANGKYSSSEHAWNAVKIGKSDDGTGGVWYYVDASRVDGRWIPGRVDYQYLLFGTSKSGYSADVTNISAAEYPLGFSRSGVCTPLALREDGFWLIRRDEHGTGLYTVSYGKNFAGSAYLGTISDAPMSILWAAVMVDDVVYYLVDSYGDTALYSYTPGMPEAEARETGLSDKFGLRLDGRTLRLVQDGQTVQSAKLRKYSGFAGTAWFGYDGRGAPGAGGGKYSAAGTGGRCDGLRRVLRRGGTDALRTGFRQRRRDLAQGCARRVYAGAVLCGGRGAAAHCGAVDNLRFINIRGQAIGLSLF